MREALVLVVLAACGQMGGGDDGGYDLELIIRSPSTFDNLVVFSPGSVDPGPGISSPEILAAGAQAPATAQIRVHDLAGQVTPMDPTTQYKYSTWQIFTPLSDLVFIAQLGQTPVAYGEIEMLTYKAVGNDVMEDDGSLMLGPLPPTLELWGSNSCLRTVDASGATAYIVSGEDRDCDGMPDTSDCQPNAFCDPTATTGAAEQACECPL